MSNALEAASLIMVPSGYEDGTLGSLKPTDGSGDFTFSRGSNLSATRINEQGYIEKGYENLLLQSNQFDTTWTKSNASVTGSQSGYDGSSDAWLLERNGTFGQVIQSITNSGVQTFSVYAKADSLNWIRLTQGSPNAYFDLSGSGAVGQVTQCIDATIESIGGGWFKCAITSNVSLTNVRIYLANGDNDLSGTTGSIYIQDAMLNQGLVAYPYIETTTAPVAGGILEDMPRLDWSGSCPSLLLEPSRTNLVTNSEYIQSNNWSNSGNYILNFNWDSSVLNPEGYYGVTSISENEDNRTLYGGFSQGDKYSISIFAKSSSNSPIRIGNQFGSENCTFNLNTGTIVEQGSNVDSYDIIDYGNDWRRYIVNATFQDSVGNGYIYMYINWDTTQNAYLYGLQLEQDATYPTSYIPTYGVSQTRLADKTDRGSNLAYTGNYTLFMEFEYSDSSFQILNQNVATNHNLLIQNDDTYFTFRSTGAQVNFLNTFDWSANSGNNIKMAFYKQGINAKMFVNGTEYTPTTNTLSTGDEVLDWRYLNFSITAGRQEQLKVKQLVEFQTALSDSECIALTTIT